MMDAVRAKVKTRGGGNTSSSDVKPWIKGFGRFGYFAKGTVYIIIGLLSMMAASGIGGSTSDTNGAFASVASKPFGEVLLWIVGVGLIGYVCWRLIQTFLDPENKGANMKGIGVRFGYFISGVIYASLSLKAFKYAMHAGSSGSSQESWTAKVMSQPFGIWVIGIIGAIVIGFGLKQMHRGYKEKFTHKFKTQEMSSHELRIGKKVGKLGLMARGLTFVIIGFFFVVTAWTSDPNEAIGLDGALGKIAQQPYGQIMLGVVAIGLFLYGVFQVWKGKSRHMRI